MILSRSLAGRGRENQASILRRSKKKGLFHFFQFERAIAQVKEPKGDGIVCIPEKVGRRKSKKRVLCPTRFEG